MLAVIVVSHPGTSFSGYCVHPPGLFRARSIAPASIAPSSRVSSKPCSDGALYGPPACLSWFRVHDRQINLWVARRLTPSWRAVISLGFVHFGVILPKK